MPAHTTRPSVRCRLSAALLLAACGTAMAAPQESTTFTGVASNACNGCSQNSVQTFTAVGSYAVGAIRISGTLTEVNTATFGTEARILVIPPTGSPFVAQPFTTTSFTGSINAVDVVIPTNGGITSAAGTWSFRFFETLDDGADFLVDATWDTITITLDDQPGPVISTLTASGEQFAEVEPNDLTYVGNLVPSLAAGQALTGNTTGSSTTVAGATSADNFDLRTATAAAGIYRHRLVITTSGAAGHAGSIRGLTQASQGAGLPGAVSQLSDAAIQTSATTTTPPRFNQWYGFGRSERIRYRITGTASTTGNYTATLSTDPVTPITVANPLVAGPVTIARATGNTTAVDMWLFDGNLQPIADAGNQGNNTLTRTLASGTYYLAVSNANTATNLPSPADDTTRTGNVMEFPDGVINSSTTTIANLGMAFTHAAGVETAAGSKAGPFEVVFYQFNVVLPATPVGSGSISPALPVTGRNAVIAVNVVRADGLPNDITSVAVDGAGIGLGVLNLNDSGLNGDAVAGDNIWSLGFGIPAGASAGAVSLPFTITDVQNRVGNGSVGFTLNNPPANDTCATPTVASVGATPFDCRFAATEGTADTCAPGGAANNDVWFSFTPTVTGPYRIETCGAGFDTVLSIYTSCGTAPVACNNDACLTASRIPAFVGLAGTTYLIRVAGAGAAAGQGTLTIASLVLAGPINNPANNSNYYLLERGLTWPDAQTAAVQMGGYLAVIDDANENEFVRANVLRFGGTDRRGWIGFSDEATEGTFVWANGSTSTYTNWNTGEPNNGGAGGEDYTEMLGGSGLWNDLAAVGVSGGGDWSLVEIPGAPLGCNVADIVGIGGTPPADGLLTGDDFNAFIAAFASNDTLADIVGIGGQPPADGLITGDDFNAFIAAFAAGCP